MTKFREESNPDLVSTKYPMMSAAYFFDKNKLWSICDKGSDDETVKLLTKRINGGINQFDVDYGTMSLPTFDDFQRTWWGSKPVSKFTQTLINK